MTPLPGWHLCVDQPHVLIAAEGGIEISGWCFNEASALRAEVQLIIKDRVFACESGLPRPDVGTAFPAHPAATVSGFIFRGWMPSGYETLKIQARTGESDWQTLRVMPFFGETGPLICQIDFPLDDSVEEEEITVSGWALHSQERIGKLSLHQGSSIVECHYGTARPDLERQFSSLPGSDRCGFYALLRTSTPGPITLEAELLSGRVAASSPGKALSLKNQQIYDESMRLELEMAGCLSIPRDEKPSVSIIIPVYDQIDVTLDCLRSIKHNSIGLAYEVIVVDDNSSTHTQECLDRVDGLHILRHSANAGFLDSCNDGAGVARGEFLIFLNNDTEPQKGWIQALLRVFKDRPDAGLVGAKLVYPDGRLQEAGGIIFNDASGWNYGRNDHPQKPEYNYVREVDYCSGACIAIRRSLFEKVGGFDRRYVPAYYEDTDLAFKIRDAGYKVYYQPQAVVTHHEGRTSGTSTEAGIKRYQVVNQSKFRTKWEEALSRQFQPDARLVPRAKELGSTKRVLVIDARVLCPDQDSGSLRMSNLLTVFQQLGFKVTFLPMNSQFLPRYTEAMQEQGVEAIYDPFMVSFESFIISRGNEFDLIVISRATVAETSLPICLKYCPEVPRIFDTVDLHFLREEREAELSENAEKRQKAGQTRALELNVITNCDAALVVSPFEQEVIARALPAARVAIVSNIHRVEETVAPFTGRQDFVFVGGFEHPPNVDGMIWFASSILPKILVQMPDAKLHIIGSKMPPTVRDLANENIITHGYVKDVAPFLSSCVLSVAPLRYGAGVKGKINQSMSFGLPVVSTSCGAEGMHLTHEHDILIADEPADFAREIVRLARDKQLWERLSRNSLRNIEKHFSFATARRDLRALLLDLGILTPVPSGETLAAAER